MSWFGAKKQVVTSPEDLEAIRRWREVVERKRVWLEKIQTYTSEERLNSTLEAAGLCPLAQLKDRWVSYTVCFSENDTKECSDYAGRIEGVTNRDWMFLSILVSHGPGDRPVVLNWNTEVWKIRIGHETKNIEHLVLL